MRNSYQVIRQLDDFTQFVYTYYLLDDVLYLDTYEKLTRKTKRHKFQREEFYDRLSRASTIKEPKDVPNLPDTETVRDGYLADLKTRLKVQLWSDRK